MEVVTTALADDRVVSLFNRDEEEKEDESLEVVEKDRNNNKHRTANSRIPK
jgi:hypothetical protein